MVHKVPGLLLAISDAYKAQFSKLEAKVLQNQISFTKGTRTVDIQYTDEGAKVTIKDGFERSTAFLSNVTIGPTIQQQTYPFILWVLGFND